MEKPWERVVIAGQPHKHGQYFHHSKAEVENKQQCLIMHYILLYIFIKDKFDCGSSHAPGLGRLRWLLVSCIWSSELLASSDVTSQMTSSIV